MIWNFWYIGCASIQLKDKPVGVKVLDKELVIFRDSHGRAHALQDRCCHRGYRLSLGKKIDDAIQCGFHGWNFDGDGKCIYIPSLKEGATIPEDYLVSSFPCIERDSYIWVWLTNNYKKPNYEPKIPDFESNNWVQGSIPIACEAIKAIEINLDGAHIYFLHNSHQATIEFKKRGEKYRESKSEIRITENGFIYFWPGTDSHTDSIPNNASRIIFQIPNLIQLKTEYSGKIYNNLLNFVPTGRNSCRMEYLVSNSQPFQDHIKWNDREPDIFAEDKKILEEIQKTTDKEGEGFEKSVEADTVTLFARNIYRQLEKEDWNDLRSQLETRKIFTRRM